MFQLCARGSAAGRGQSGKGARCAPLSCFSPTGLRDDISPTHPPRRGRRVRTVARPHCPRMLVGYSLGVRRACFFYKGCHYRCSIMLFIGRRECSLAKKCARPPRYVVRMCEGPSLSRSPSRSPSQRAPLGQSGVRPLGRAFLCGGPALALPPAPPSHFIYVFSSLVWCGVSSCVVWWVSACRSGVPRRAPLGLPLVAPL